MLACLGLAVSKVAHEIGNPLNGMFSCVQLLDRETREEGVDRDRILDAMDQLCSEIGRLEALLQELRALGRPLKLNSVPVSLTALVGEVLQRLLATNSAQLVQVQTEFTEDLPHVMADAEKLKQVLFNLTKNAIEAMPGGGRLTLRAFRLKDKMCFEVQDTGVGIPKDIKIFDCFATSKPNGWGLGLSIAQQILRAHHGTIDYRSKLGHGTTFRISLPVARSFTHARQSASKPVSSLWPALNS